jgi:hypothetical protein
MYLQEHQPIQIKTQNLISILNVQLNLDYQF